MLRRKVRSFVFAETHRQNCQNPSPLGFGSLAFCFGKAKTAPLLRHLVIMDNPVHSSRNYVTLLGFGSFGSGFGGGEKFA